MEAFFDTVREWQTVVGAVLGGMFALLVAFIVAGHSQRRAERIAAHVVMTSLADFLGTAQMWIAAWEKEPEKHKYKRVHWIGERVLYGWPFVAGDFDSARASLMDVDTELAGRLAVFQKSYKSMSDARVHLLELSASGRITEGLAERYFTLVTLGLEEGAKQALLLMPLVERLFLTKRWRANRIMRRLELLFGQGWKAER